jgi:peroxiredoxin
VAIPGDYSEQLPRSDLSRRRLRSSILFIAVMIAVAFLLGFLFDLGPEPPGESVLSDVGDFPADHIWFNTSQPLSLYDQLSKHVVVVFFCNLETLSDLEYCRRLAEIQQEFDQQPLAVIAVINTDQTSVRELENVVSDWGISFPVIIDSGGTVADRFNVSTLPALLVLDARARVSARFFMGWEKADLRGIVEDLLQQLRAMRYTDIRIFHPDGGRYVPEETDF